MYIFQIFDHYAVSLILLLVALFECIAVAWIYGKFLLYTLIILKSNLYSSKEMSDMCTDQESQFDSLTCQQRLDYTVTLS